MLQRDAGSRISAEEALQHPWFAKHGVGELSLSIFCMVLDRSCRATQP